LSSDAAMLERIKIVDPVHAETMSRQPTTFTTQPLPFYKNFKLVKASIRLPHRPLEFRYADNGSKAFYLSGAVEEVYRVNDEEALGLTEGQVVPYVRFFFASTDGEKRRLVERPADVAWLPATEEDEALKAARADASQKIRPVTVSKVTNGYRVLATALQGNRLLELSLVVSSNGRVRFESTKALADNLPVAETL
jgi:hypothetical protein